jgi:hypothetical protein
MQIDPESCEQESAYARLVRRTQGFAKLLQLLRLLNSGQASPAVKATVDGWIEARQADEESRLRMMFKFVDALKLLDELRRSRKAVLTGQLKLLAEVFLLGKSKDVVRLMRCGRCEKYFLVRRKDQLFCSHRCASHVSTARSVKRRREKLRQERIDRVKTAAHACDNLRRQPQDREGWIAKRAGVTVKWITRNRKDLFPELPWETL